MCWVCTALFTKGDHGLSQQLAAMPGRVPHLLSLSARQKLLPGTGGGSGRRQRQARWAMLPSLGRQDGTAGPQLVTPAGGLRGDLCPQESLAVE